MIEKSHRCIHLQNIPQWQLEYEGITVKDEAFETFWLLCKKCSIQRAKGNSGWKIIKFPLGMPNAEKIRLQNEIPF